MNRGLDLTIALAVCIAILGLVRPEGALRRMWERHRQDTARAEIRGSYWEELTANAELLGTTGGRIIAVEFADYECPYCRMTAPTVRFLADSLQVQVAFIHVPLPIHRQARPAALSAICAAEQGRFTQMHDRLMTTDAWRSDTLWSEEAGAVGIPDVGRFLECRRSTVAAARIARDSLLALRVGIIGTPTFLTQERDWLGGVFLVDSLQ